MAIHEKEGDLLESGCDYICHQCNCQGSMAAGIAKSIAEKYPRVADKYFEKCTNDKNPLSKSQFVYIEEEDIVIINMFSQKYYGRRGQRYTNYEAFYKCLEEIAAAAEPGATIGFPERIGCDRAGANWNIIKTMIIEVLSDKFEVYIYHLPN